MKNTFVFSLLCLKKLVFNFILSYNLHSKLLVLCIIILSLSCQKKQKPIKSYSCVGLDCESSGSYPKNELEIYKEHQGLTGIPQAPKPSRQDEQDDNDTYYPSPYPPNREHNPHNPSQNSIKGGGKSPYQSPYQGNYQNQNQNIRPQKNRAILLNYNFDSKFCQDHYKCNIEITISKNTPTNSLDYKKNSSLDFIYADEIVNYKVFKNHKSLSNNNISYGNYFDSSLSKIAYKTLKTNPKKVSAIKLYIDQSTFKTIDNLFLNYNKNYHYKLILSYKDHKLVKNLDHDLLSQLDTSLISGMFGMGVLDINNQDNSSYSDDYYKDSNLLAESLFTWINQELATNF